MRDEAHIGLVDAHAEGDGGDDDDAFLLQKHALMIGAGVLVEARMIGQCETPFIAQPLCRFLDLFARQAVNDTGVGRVVGLDEGP